MSLCLYGNPADVESSDNAGVSRGPIGTAEPVMAALGHRAKRRAVAGAQDIAAGMASQHRLAVYRRDDPLGRANALARQARRWAESRRTDPRPQCRPRLRDLRGTRGALKSAGSLLAAGEQRPSRSSPRHRGSAARAHGRDRSDTPMPRKSQRPPCPLASPSRPARHASWRPYLGLCRNAPMRR